MSLIKKALSVFTAGLIAASGMTAASAHTIEESGLPLISREGVSTEVIFTDGTEKTYDGLPDVSRLESRSVVSSVAAYTVLGKDTELLSVTLNGISADGGSVGASSRKMNGYYAVEFTFPDSQREAFLTGLTPANLEETQNALIDSFVYGEELQLENFSFIDAEKTNFSHNDDLLCWAATVSNTLNYAGWLEQTEFGDSDDLLDQFDKDFAGGAFDAFDGYRWFLNGVCKPYGGSATPKKRGSGAYMKEYPYELLTENVSLMNDQIQQTKLLQQRLREGCGVGLGILFETGGGHAISCWGYINDNSYDENDSRHYTALVISDSDSDIQPQEDRRVAPNKLNVLSLEFIDRTWKLPTYKNASLTSFTTILPFTKAQEYLDPDPCSTKDRVNDVDFSPSSFTVGTGDFPWLDRSMTLYAGMKPVMSFVVNNMSISSYSGELEYRITVENTAGETVLNEVHTSYITIRSMEIANINFEIFRSSLPAGSYTAELELNCGKKLDEAFYFNNKTFASFEVAESGVDVSNLGVSVSVSEIDEDNYVEAAVDYTGFEEASGDVTLVSTVYKSGMMNNGKMSWDYSWTLYSREGEPRGVGAQASVQKQIKAADAYVFCAYYRVKNMGEMFYVYSDVIYPPTFGSEIIPSQIQGSIDMPDGGGSLGEKIGFTVKNTSAEAYGNLRGEAYMMFKTTDSSGVTKTIRIGDSAELDLAPDAVSPEISIDSFPDGIAKEGLYRVYAVVEGNVGDHYIRKESQLKEIRFREKPSVFVTTSSDSTNPYDNRTSLREAAAVYDGSAPISFSKEIKGGSGYSLTLDDTLIIDKNVVISAPQDGESSVVKISSSNVGKPVFEVKKQGDLTLRGIRLTGSVRKGVNDDIAALNGGCIICDGGSVTLESCVLSSYIAKTYGGAIYCNGGRLKASSCKFSGNGASFGGAAALNNNAKGDFINCGFDGNFSDKGAVFNNNSELNMVSCSLFKNYKTEVYGTNGACAVTSYGNTSLLNCVLADNLPDDDDNIPYVPYDLAGTVKLYGCAYTSADSRVEADAQCISGISRDDVLFYNITSPSKGDPDYVFKPVSVTVGGDTAYDSYYLPNPKITSKGMSVSVRGGLFVYTDGTDTFETGIPAAFGEELCGVDAIGNSRGAEFGCISDFTQTEDAKGYNMGDVNGDGRIDISDATLLQRYIAEAAELDAAQLAAAELYHEKNNLGTDISKYITISNVTEIQKYIAEYIYEFSKFH